MITPLLIIILIIFGIIIASYAIKGVDYVAIALLGSFIAATLTGLVKGIDLESFIGFIEWKAIILILSMSLITKIAVDSNILEVLAVKLYQLAKGRRRVFFLLLIVLTTLLAAIVSDVIVIIILAPIVIRLFSYLKVKAGTYLAGMSLSVKLGSIITPFASNENIIISTHYSLDISFFIQYFWVFAFILLFITIFLLHKFFLSKEQRTDPQLKELMLQVIDTDILIKNRKMFYINSIAILITIVLFLILPLLYLTAALAAFILVLVNKRFTKQPISKMLKDVDWEILFFLISLYVIIGCLLEAGFGDLFTLIAFETIDPIVVYLLLFIIISLMSAFVSNTPTTLIFLPIIDTLINLGFPPVPLLFIFIFGIHLGGNLVPQGSTVHIATLNIAERSGVENLNYRRLLGIGSTFTIIHMACSIGFLFIIILLAG